ncbi:MAG: transcription-repair coupling factor [Polyangiaceae bacterium]|nr:transcription-repair coupling factor [Polyangiaceae bacterium]MCW5789949.1 transcription-repair coupling factor [Polyangiaceae bacterium]
MTHSEEPRSSDDLDCHTDNLATERAALAATERTEARQQRAIAGLVKSLLTARGPVHVVRAGGISPALVTQRLVEAGRQVLHVCPTREDAQRAHADSRYLSRGPALGPEPLHPTPPSLLYLPPEADVYAEVHQDRRAAMSRTATLSRLISAPWGSLCVPASALVRQVPPPASIQEATARLELGDEVDLEALSQRLIQAGWLRAPVVEDPGSFAIRGGLLDLWPPGERTPTRVELDFERVARLRPFDPDDQRTAQGHPELEALWLPPAREAFLSQARVARARELLRDLCDAVDLPSTKARLLIDDVAGGTTFFGAEAYLPAFTELTSIISYLPESAVIVLERPEQALLQIDDELGRALASELASHERPHFPLEALCADRQSIERALMPRAVACCHVVGIADSDRSRPLAALADAGTEAPSLGIEDQQELASSLKLARQSGGAKEALDPLIARLEAWQSDGLTVRLVARGSTQASRLTQLLRHRDVELEVSVGEAARGAIAPLEGFVLLTEEEIFGSRAHRERPKRRTSTRGALEDLRALSEGDFVVHVEHGIGRYLGLTTRQVAGNTVELLTVEYAAGDRLFVPVYRLNQIQKYSAGEAAPKLDRLGGQSFSKTKAKVARRVRQMADDLLKLYAERMAVEKLPLPPADEEYHAFEATFPYEETRDQAAAISEVNQDLESTKVMDRLVCGDVGFGKTEVAIRAAFRVASQGRQVALLCPTTVLAQQHFLTLQGRLQDYPLRVAVLSRFVSKSNQTQILKDLKAGLIDVVVGTHRLLSKDVHFKELGLLIVDEEQRFGVAHKERVKQMRGSVDVLTLTATPIPRTLQLAIGGLRDLSIIATPPTDRRAVRTITSRWDDELVQRAIRSELARGGQVFYVYNRVEGIYERAARLSELVPEARIAVGHGQLSEAALEKTMLGFVAGDYDVLAATAIVESGLDIPRANTILIDRADLFGLSQLYQLRGRVGRARERAYCYLLVPPSDKMTDEARTRVEALERYHDLGAGFQVASLDMEQRGAGDLLGGEQSGFVASVGFELFCQMLEEAAREIRGEAVVHTVDPELSFDVDALLPEDYVGEVGVRLSLYKRLASAADAGDVELIASEMEDRFGPAPREAVALVELMRLKTELRALGVLGCEASAQSVTLHLAPNTPLRAEAVTRLVSERARAYRLTPDMRLTRRLRPGEVVQSGLELASRMLSELTPLAS